MRQKRNSRPSLATALVMSLLVAALTIWLVCGRRGWRSPVTPSQKYTLAHVQRTDLYPALTAGGRVESVRRTVIQCELENIHAGVMGQRLTAGGASVLLSIVPDGSVVHKGDVLAVLDSSDYEEVLRQEQMTVERARADFKAAELSNEIAKLAVHEFRDGSMKEAIKEFEGSLALAESDLVRIKDRLDWARRMKKKGYVPAAQVSSEEFNHARALFALSEERAAYELYTKWMAPHTLRELEVNVLGTQATLDYERSRLTRHLDRQARLEKQVKLCTLRAPHDGFVIYANDTRRHIIIEEGMDVRQRQTLMYLPELDKLEVVTTLHESIVREVAKGMRAKVRVEGLPGRKLEGRVTEIATLPTFNWFSDVRYFDSKVRLENPPQGILPGMTAQVEISLNRKDDVLAVPTLAIAHEDGREFCYVVHDDGLERREVRLGEGTRDMLEISEGLHEGEDVVLNPHPSELEEDIIDETLLVSRARSPDGPVEKVANLPEHELSRKAPAARQADALQ
jgi:HlyD family secretion protein